MKIRTLSSALAATVLATASLIAIAPIAPANAANLSGTTSVSTFTAGVGTPSFTYTTTSSTSFRKIEVAATLGVSTTGFRIPTACVGNGKSFTDCGISSLTVGGVAMNSGSDVTIDGIGGYPSYPSMTFNFTSAKTGAIVITFASGAWTPPDLNTTFDFKAITRDAVGSTIDTFTAPVTVTGARSLVIMYQNLNAQDYTQVEQRASSPTALNANTFTRVGYTFGGWATSRTSTTVAYADGAQFPFTSPSTQGPPTLLYAIWIEGNGGGGSNSSTPSATLTLNAATGALVAGSTVAISATGLQATAPYTVVVRSTPQTIGSGTAVNGTVSTSVTLPAGLAAGWHTLTFSSTAADGSPMTSVAYFNVSETGTLLATTTTKPAELANTGANPMLPLGLATLLLLAGATFVMRRKTA